MGSLQMDGEKAMSYLGVGLEVLSVDKIVINCQPKWIKNLRYYLGFQVTDRR